MVVAYSAGCPKGMCLSAIVKAHAPQRNQLTAKLGAPLQNSKSQQLISHSTAALTFLQTSSLQNGL